MAEQRSSEQRPVGAPTPEELVERVRERYGKIGSTGGSCCGSTAVADPTGTTSENLGYAQDELTSAPEGADLSLGCGAPIPFLDPQPGETVADLGSGGGLDAFLAAPKVGPNGRVIGVDMTPEMISRARENAERDGVENVEFRQGRLESLPLDDASVDAVTSNCVFNLVPDKAAVFREVARVLRPGGRLVVSDIVLDGPLPKAVEQDLLAYVGCVAGAAERDNYFETLRTAGLDDVVVLKDLDFLAAVDGCVPADVAELLERCEVDLADLEGKVRSVTYRAYKR
jgi:SAM-dependent methyltransferase